MSVVVSKIFKHKDKRDVEYTLKSYALDDKFSLDMYRFSVMGGANAIRMDFSVEEAKTLKKQLEEFIAQNT